MSKLLETFQELNLSNYGPDDVDQLNAWAIDAYAELSALKAQEPVAWAGVIEDCASLFVTEPQLWKAIPLYAAPVSEAKAQVVIPDEREAFEKWGETLFYTACFERHESDEYAGRGLQGAWLGWQARAALNSAPVQQVSVPDGKVCVPVEVLRLYEFMAASFTPFTSQHEQIAISLRKAKAAMLAAPAAPAADGWISVGDRLPEVESRLDQECRAGTLSIAPLNVSAAVLVFDGEKVRSTRLEWFDGCLPLPYCITHWMPLPAAPAAHSSKGVA